MKLAIGCDDAAFELKELIKRYLIEKGLDVTDFGTYDTQPVNYPNIAFAVAESIVRGESERAVLLCDGPAIGLDHLPTDKLDPARSPKPTPPSRASTNSSASRSCPMPTSSRPTSSSSVS